MLLHRGRLLAAVTTALSVTACNRAPAPCVCPEPAAAVARDEPAAAPAVATPEIAAPEVAAPGTLPGASQLHPSGPEARLALEVATDLFNGRVQAAYGRFTPALRGQLSAARLEQIVAGVTSAHGPPVEVMDAWLGEVEEEERRLPAAQVLLRMANDVRFRLLLVIAPSGDVDGLWLRPI
ncbi:MAG: hypothetical protein CVU56_26680 [Deltaproteobacteria bacterium HGW-Deltaproteobacteria-14]|jgi:hypothetical protein|nr:MAG: hypothetical protein CVU56_26680 [Deltaproteobacteria bacterium HGW-Deltaproteobacteria-14]